MTSFWNLFILFICINIGFLFVPSAFQQSQNTSDNFEGIDFSNFNNVEFPEALTVDYVSEINDNPSCGTTNTDTLIGKLCLEGKIQNINTLANVTGGSSIQNIATTQIEGAVSWIDQITDFGQILVFGIQLLFSAVTGGFIVSVMTTTIFNDELPNEFIIGVQVLIGLMWLSFFFKQTIGRQLNPSE